MVNVVINYGEISSIVFCQEEQETVEMYMEEFDKIITEDLSVEEFKKQINKFLNSKKRIANLENAMLISSGNHFMEKEEFEKGNILLQKAYERPVGDCYEDEIYLFLRLAQYQFLAGNEEKGTEYLIRLCEGEISNYVEAIEHRGLLEIWGKYKHYIEGKVRESYSTVSQIKAPSECKMQIADILQIKDEDRMLAELSEHLGEMCGNGEALNYLNKWERNIYYIDHLWMEVNSGGFDSYLFFHGNYFEKAKKACKELEVDELVCLMEKVDAKFPRGKVPKKLDRIQTLIEEKDLDFEEIDDEFYDRFGSIITDGLIKYIKQYTDKLR